MRKFTKEIATLLAAVSVSASANMASEPAENANAASNNSTSMSVLDSTIGTVVSTAATTTKVTTRLSPAPGSTLPPDEGVAMPPDEDVTFPPDEGVQMIPDEYTTTTRATITTKVGTQTSKLTTTTTTTTTTTVGTEVSKLTTTTTTVPANDNIELPLEEIEIGGGEFTDDNIYGEYAAFYAQGAEYVILQYSVVGNCDEFEGVFMTAVDGELVEEPFTASVKNGVAKISYHVPFNSDDYITAVVFNPEDKGIALENVELVNLESRTTTSIPPLMGTEMPTSTTTTQTYIAGDMMPSDEETTTTTTVPPLAGVPLPPDEYTTTTTIPPFMGTEMPTSTTTTQTYIAGGMMPSDEGTTTTTTTTIPPLMGTEMPTTVTTTIPPMMGDMQIRIYGDANNDSAVSIADAAAILQYIANPDKYGLSEKGMLAADVVGNGNGITVDDAIAIQKLDAKIIDDFSELE